MIEEILTRHGKNIASQIQANLNASGENATGETSKSVRYEVEYKEGKSTLTVIGGRQFFPTVETGSKPSEKNPSPEMVQSLKEWAEAKGLEISPWGTAVNILRHGSKLWQAGGRRDIYTSVKNEAIKPLAAEIAKSEKDLIVKSLINPVKL